MKFSVSIVLLGLSLLVAVEAHDHTGSEQDPGFDVDQVDLRLRGAANNKKADSPIKTDFMFRRELSEKPDRFNASDAIIL
jgi:hypothetical protein